MSRDFAINGETLVKLKGSVNSFLNDPVELGLASDSIVVSFDYQHKPVFVDDFGPYVPAEQRVMMATADIRMNLIHYERDYLQAALAESLGGQYISLIGGTPGGILNPAGTLLANGLRQFASGNHYISLNLLSPVYSTPWRFPTTFLCETPVEIPLGTSVSILKLHFKAVPYLNRVTFYDVGTSVSGQAAGGTLNWYKHHGFLPMEEYNAALDIYNNNLPLGLPGYAYIAGPLINSGEILSSGAFLYDRALDVRIPQQNQSGSDTSTGVAIP